MKKFFFLCMICFLTLSAQTQNVGIGTTTPLTKLHVFNGASGATPFVFSRLAVESNGHTYINLLSPAANETAILFGQPGSAANGVIMYNNEGTSNGFQFRNNSNQTRMVIDSTGNVGIGITTPTASLEVMRGTGAGGTAVFRGTTHISHFNYSTDENTYIRAGKDYRNVIINDIPGGKVGVGTSSPTEKLQVAGNIKADTVKPAALKLTPNAGVGKVLTSDATGNANWQTSSASGGVGFGSWGDCSMNGISEYNPIADATGAAFDQFGYSVSISGNYAIVGSVGDDIGANIDQGSASIYQHNGSIWILMQKITDATGAAIDNFGISVSISGNYAIVGAAWDDGAAGSDQGSASIYQYNGSSWVLMQKITDATGAASDLFGISVSISGNYAIVGAAWDDGAAGSDQGSASIYQYNGSSWILMQKITDATGDIDDEFGNGVSISGNYAIVGAFSDDVGANFNSGSASVYQYNGSSWVLMQKISDADGAANDQFGNNVSISGNYAIVGAFHDDVGANSQQGSASIFQYNGSNWVQMQKITNTTGATGDWFGNSVSISGNFAIVGANGDDVGVNSNQGAASIYVRVGLLWQKIQYITDPGGYASDLFGSATVIDGATQRFMIGASGYASFGGKIVFGKIN